ncbi:hypothetical protein EVAR_43065_1 [Eumeta japonica]|uniref:Uncharacterized protein n=1 Tax=Eumeta variegata TaxID=151549 RepID=A0A4C1WVF3_EUMVA|nr:hypothetical protein EVAR_43065_1 [Eumeta japonica]
MFQFRTTDNIDGHTRYSYIPHLINGHILSAYRDAVPYAGQRRDNEITIKAMITDRGQCRSACISGSAGRSLLLCKRHSSEKISSALALNHAFGYKTN